MSSLWTPDGEHRVTRESGPAPAPPPAAEGGTGEGSPRPPTDPSFAGEPSEDEMRMLAEQLLSAPVEDVIANHCFGLFELAALHLSQQPPNLEAARAAIDAMGFLVEGLGSRLGQHQATLAEGLGQVRLAFVRIAETFAGPQADGGAPPGAKPS